MIGVIDSGVGGLSVMPMMVKAMPRETFIYLGDNARFPYGQKPPRALKDNALELSDYLHRRGVKAIVLACGTLSSYALEVIAKEFHLPVFGTIKATSRESDRRDGNKIVWATPATIDSYAFQRELKGKVKYQSCPHLAKSVEQDSRVSEVNDNADVIIMGCTHYSWLDIGDKVKVDGSFELSREVRLTLRDGGLLSKQKEGDNEFLFTGDITKPQYLVSGLFPTAKVKRVNLKEELSDVPDSRQTKRN